MFLTVIDPEERISHCRVSMGSIFKRCQCDRTIELWLTRHSHESKNSSGVYCHEENIVIWFWRDICKVYVDIFCQVSVTHAVKKWPELAKPAKPWGIFITQIALYAVRVEERYAAKRSIMFTEGYTVRKIIWYVRH